MSDLAKYKMTLGLNCQPCHRWVEIIPQDWLDAGKPDIDYVEQRFKCEVCGGRPTSRSGRLMSARLLSTCRSRRQKPNLPRNYHLPARTPKRKTPPKPPEMTIIHIVVCIYTD